jgi:CheY-like chemotaxis protein
MQDTILVVEDNLIILASTSLMLTKWGYHVLTADTPRKAMALSREHPGSLDLLLTDLLMEDMSGAELATRLRSTQPNLKVIFTTGADREQLDDMLASLDRIRVLSKPVSMDRLKVCVHEAITAE